MLIVGVPQTELTALDAAGTQVKINFRPVTLRRRGSNLVYTDKFGKENRCRILDSVTEGDRVTFFAASHDGEGGHAVIRPDSSEGDQS